MARHTVYLYDIAKASPSVRAPLQHRHPKCDWPPSETRTRNARATEGKWMGTWDLTMKNDGLIS